MVVAEDGDEGISRGEAVGGAKQKNMVVAGQAKSRRKLGDIGNLVTLRPLDDKPLLANKKNPMEVIIENNKVVVPKKKVSVKPKPAPVPQNTTMIKISPDTEELKKPESS